MVKRIFSLLWTVQITSGLHTASIHCILGVLLLGVVKWLGSEADHPPSSSTGIKNRGLCLHCLHRDNFLTFTYHSWLSFLFIRHTAAEKNDGGWMVWAQMWATTKKELCNAFFIKFEKNALIKHTELCIFIGYHFGTQTLFHWRVVRPPHDASARSNAFGLTQVHCMVSSFCCDVDLNCVLLGYYTLSSGNFLPMFLNNLWVPSSRVKNPRRK
jgi:hypothetical protein